MKIPGEYLRKAARLFGTPIRDIHTGMILGKAFLFTWRGKIHIMGYTGKIPLRPAPLPSAGLSYSHLTLGFTQPVQPDFPKSVPGESLE